MMLVLDGSTPHVLRNLTASTKSASLTMFFTSSEASGDGIPDSASAVNNTCSPSVFLNGVGRSPVKASNTS